jgi:lysine-specific demethylase/histidyl-hydroxylase NO66
MRTPALRVARNGRILSEASYTQQATLAGKPVTGLVDPRRLLALFDEGATIVFQGLQRYWPPVTELIADLERELGHPCQANAYLTPPGAQGFAVHADTHDVFVLQTEGRKDWELHLDHEVEQLVMDPGRCVYLPTGTRHAARTQESVSLHLTIGINQLTVNQVVRRAVDAALRDLPDEHLPAGLIGDPTAAADLVQERLAALADVLRGADATTLVQDRVDAVATTRPPRMPGALLDRVALADPDGLSDATLLERRATAFCELRRAPETGRLLVLLGDRTLDVPPELRPALERIQANPTLTPGDLADLLDPTSRIVLCRRLIREGLLQIVQPTPSSQPAL